ncbi:MAG TPA: Asp-tRNA(Asn)/Glu-tRNA(Gln) amidotransferase subunit GatC [Candidatus Paceibacterota bacterium]|nr:Asp-tRNA(Asn)/Glu-tRNA(Gln) amidotransferase subunit GatC [Candidatus Paceibacterota bacterium]
MAIAEEVKKLAALARIRVNDAELGKFASEFDAILAYVGQLETLDLAHRFKRESPLLENVMREDSDPHPSGSYTEKLVAQFPARNEGALSVKRIISHD